MSSLAFRVSLTFSVHTSPNRSVRSSEEPGNFTTMFLTMIIFADPMRRIQPRISVLYRLHRGPHRGDYPDIMDEDVRE
ncbi:uncharacterized protein AtWU_09844 [Aspergillus tubingensis]|uniref:uncharacterized protein n=1 Tax=Aspergillus tubingensis TaxID=5068 RepID=UPI001579664D|nr:uncharacterized protein AtWU_09844 [Aspergillus tubingensis]GFN20039.1 hypothetical protein AtWU_09844 [Aspergillus tubingensis]